MKDKHLKKIVTAILVYWIIFVCFTWITFYLKDSIPDTLVQYGLGGGAIELICTAIIEGCKKKFESSGEDKSISLNDFIVKKGEKRI